MNSSQSNEIYTNICIELFELKNFPDFGDQNIYCPDICQNFSFLKVQQINHKMREFCLFNIKRLQEIDTPDQTLQKFLISNLKHSILKMDRVIKFLIMNICKSMAVYSGLLMRYDSIIQKGVEGLNKLISHHVTRARNQIENYSIIGIEFFNYAPFK